MRLLVIEDDTTLRETLAARLADHGFAVEQAADGKEGLYFATEYPIDLAIVDLGLPEMSGLDIIRNVREQGKTYPILILTARDRWEDKVNGLDAGADDYVVKPFHHEEVTARVNALLRRSGGWASSELKAGPITLDMSRQGQDAVYLDRYVGRRIVERQCGDDAGQNRGNDFNRFGGPGADGLPLLLPHLERDQRSPGAVRIGEMHLAVLALRSPAVEDAP